LSLLVWSGVFFTPFPKEEISGYIAHGPIIRVFMVSLTEVQRISFVGYTGGVGGSPGLWNLQNLHAVPPYELLFYSSPALGLSTKAFCPHIFILA